MKYLSMLLMTGMAMAVTQNTLADEKETLLGGTISGSLKLATDYVFRGESESNDAEIPAVQGSITWSHPSGFYLGYFGSTNKFPTSKDIYAVVGPYFGKSGSISDSGVGYNVMAFVYQYPGARHYNYSELYMYLNKQFGPVNLKLEVTPTLEDWFGVKGWSGVNYALHPKIELSNGFAIDGSIGEQKLSGTGAEGWRHWNIGVTKSKWGLNFDLRYHDTNLDSSHKVYGNPEGVKIFKERLVLAVSKTF